MVNLEVLAVRIEGHRRRNDSEDLDLSPLVSTIVKLPKIRDITVIKPRAAASCPTVTTECVREFCRSTTIQHANVWFMSEGSDKWDIIREELPRNFTLQSLHWRFSYPDYEMAPLFEDLMVEKFSLQQIVGLDHVLPPFSPMQRVQSYCNLNKANRYKVFNSPRSPRADWIKLLVAVTDDVNALYYVLSKNPSLCDVKNTPHLRNPDEIVRATRRKRTTATHD